MKLAEAIRLGGVLHPQAFGAWVEYKEKAKVHETATCALGGALEAVGVDIAAVDRRARSGRPFLKLLKSFFPVCRNSGVWHCKICDAGLLGLITLVQHLNDNHHMTREQIASYIESSEDEIIARRIERKRRGRVEVTAPEKIVA